MNSWEALRIHNIGTLECHFQKDGDFYLFCLLPCLQFLKEDPDIVDSQYIYVE